MTTKDPDGTRKKLLEAALHEFHANGFQGASLDNIVQGTGVTKGALYHHFPNKAALGYAVVDEILRTWVMERWVEPLFETSDPIACLRGCAEEAMSQLSHDEVCLGCPVNNLAQELSQIDDGFRSRIEAIFNDWRAGLARALRGGQDAGTVRADVDVERTAAFIVASLEGMVGAAKSAQSMELLRSMAGVMFDFLDGLRVQESERVA